MPISFSVNRVTHLQTDNDNDGFADAGDVLRHILTLTNNDPSVDATGVVVNDTLLGSTPTGLINISPIAFNESYTAFGNTLFEVGNATNQTGPQSFFNGNILTNDAGAISGDGVPGFTISALQATAVVGIGPVTAASANGGTVTLITDGVDAGSFTYVSAAGFTGTDTFTYTIKDAGIDGIAGNLDDTSSTATVTITVANKIWYVDASAGPGGTGTSTNPFDSLDDVTGATGPDAAGDIIYLNTGTYDHGITLLNNQTLVGEGSALVVGVTTLAAAGTDATITNTGATNGTNGVVLGQGDTLLGFTVGNTGGFDIANTTATTVGTLTISNVDLTGTGGLFRADSGGALTVTFDTASTTSASGNGIQLGGALTGSFTATGGAISGVTGTDVLINGGTETVSIGSSISSSAGGSIDIGSHNANVTLSGAINISGGTGISVHNNTGGTISFSGGKAVSTGANNAVDLDTNAGATINFTNGGLDLDTTSGIAFQATGGGTVSVSGGSNSLTTTTGTALDLASVTVGVNGITFATATTASAANGITIASVGQAAGSTGIDILGGAIVNAGTRGVDIDSTSADVTVNSTISTSSSGRSVEVTDSGSAAGSTINFGGAIDDNGGGINLDNNDASNGATINFTGSLDIDTTTNVGFNAVNGGTINATNTANSIASVSATALNVANTTIGANDLVFHDISSGNNTAAADPSFGIRLNTTGSAGGLHISGTGTTDGTGGTIQTIATRGIELISTADVILNNMTLTNANTTNGTSLDLDVSGSNAAIYMSGVTGASLTNVDIDTTADSGIVGINVSNFVMNNSTITQAGNAANESGIEFSNLSGNSSISNTDISFSETNSIDVVNTDVSLNLVLNNVILRDTQTVSSGGATNANGEGGFQFRSFSSAAGSPVTNIDILDSDFLRLRTQAIQVIGQNDSTVSADITNNTIDVGTDIGSGIDINSNDTANVTFNVIGNPTIHTRGGAGVNITSFLGSSIMGRINSNNILVDGSGAGGSGVRVIAQETSHATVLVQNNSITAGTANNSEPIFAQARFQTARLDLTLDNNNTNSDATAVSDIDILSGSSTAGESNQVFVSILNNDVTAGGSPILLRLRVSDLSNTNRMFLTGFVEGGGGLDDDAVATWNARGNTPLATTANVNVSLTGTAVAPSNGTAQTPTNPTPLMASFVPPPPAISAPPPPGNDPNGSNIVDDGAGGAPTPGDTGGHLPPTAPTGGPATVQFDPAPATPAVVDDGILTQAEVNLIVAAAIDRWAAAGATPEEIAAMRAVSVTVEDLAGLALGSSTAGHIRLDVNAAGFNWFVDATPGEDSEYSGTGTELHADPASLAGVRIDLLTTVMHELGHQIGLGDSYSQADRDDLMYGTINPGERRLPDGDDVAEATGTPNTGIDFALSPVNLGTVPFGRTVTIQWDSTVNAYTNGIVPTFTNHSTVSGSNFVSAVSNDETLSGTSPGLALDSLTLGGTIWNDNGAGGGTANNGVKDGTEAGVDGVALSLFVDANDDNVPDTPGSPIATLTTSGGGNYSFTNLAPGNYIVRVDADNFDAGGNVSLLNKVSSPGSPDPDNDVDNDDNGFISAGAAFSNAITLAQNSEPTQDASLHFDINNTLDFGFVQLNQAPAFAALNGTPTFTEGGAAQVLDSDATVTDPDLTATNYNGATLTLARSGAASAQDVFGDSGTLDLTGSGSGNVDIGATTVGTYTQSGGTLVITFNASATQALVNSTLQQLTYANSSDNPPASAVIAYAFSDGNVGAQGAGGAGTASGSVTVSITGVDDPAVAVNDPGNATNENATVNIAVLANDSDPDGPLSVVKVNGTTISVGSPVTLGSGAIVSLNLDGTLTYDPNGQFNTLTSTASGEIGAVNTSAPDSFTYTLGGTGGGTATVSITVNGVVSVQDHLEGNSGDNNITGTPIGDFFDLSQGGNDTATGLGGNDGFFFGATFTALDQVDGGGGTNDQIGLQGNYTGGNALVLGATTITNVEAIVVLPGFSYDITTNNGNVAAGGILKVQATQLAAGQSLTFNGSAETDGAFLLYGGNGNDNFTGGAGNDGFYFGPGGFNSSDTVNGGPGGNDQLGLDGSYGAFGPAFVLGGNVTNVEVVVLLPGPSGTPNTFNLTTSDAFVPAAGTMTIFGLQVTTDITFDGSHEHDGAFRIYGGSGNDVFTGSTGNDWIFGGGGGDTLIGGAGADTFYYDAASQSTSLGFDKIFGFDDDVDKIDLPFGVATFSAPASGTLSSASFDTDLAAAFAGLTSHQAGMFTATGGDMSGRTFLVIDADGNAGYQAGSDYVMEIVTPLTPLDNSGMFV